MFFLFVFLNYFIEMFDLSTARFTFFCQKPFTAPKRDNTKIDTTKIF